LEFYRGTRGGPDPPAKRAINVGVRPRPLEALNLLTLALLSALALWLDGRVSDAAGILTRYGLMAAGVLIVMAVVRREDRLPPLLRVLVNFYPVAFVPILYESLGPLIAAVRPVARDDLLIAADRWIFGGDPTVWLQRFLRPALTDLFFVAYLTYYFIAIALGAVFWRRSPPTARRFIFTLTLAYVVSYAGYFALPALGPRVALASRHSVPLETTSLSRTISSTLDELENTKFDVFPSGHTMIAVVVMIVAFQRARDAFWWLLPVAVCLVISTVYCRYHYVVDVIAGTVLAVITVPLGDRIYDWAVQSRASRVDSSRIPPPADS
jgi:membrane-associated phospholipid phosphatase